MEPVSWIRGLSLIVLTIAIRDRGEMLALARSAAQGDTALIDYAVASASELAVLDAVDVSLAAEEAKGITALACPGRAVSSFAGGRRRLSCLNTIRATQAKGL